MAFLMALGSTLLMRADMPLPPLDVGEVLRCVEPLLRCNIGAAHARVANAGGLPLTKKVCTDP